MWNEYFPNSVIVGLDISVLTLDPQGYTNPENVNIEHADQANKYQLEKITKKYGNFDIIIDDGSHLSSHHM